MIHKMIKEGLSKSAIARKLGISRDTVSKYAKLPEGHIPVIKRTPMGTTVDAYLPHIASMLIKADELNIHIPSTAIYEEIKKMGYTGSLRWMQEVMQKHSPDAGRLGGVSQRRTFCVCGNHGILQGFVCGIC